MNLQEITAQVTALMNRRDFTADTALQTTFINQGIMRIQRELRCPAMEKQVQVTVTSPFTGLVIPSDLLELIDLYDTSINIKMAKVDLTKALNGANDGNIGPPTAYCRQGSTWILSPTPPVGNVIQVDYYADLPPLVNPTDTNTISVIAWDLVVFAALVQAGVYYKDARVGSVQPDGSYDGWEGQYRMILKDLQDQGDEDDQNGAAQVEPAYIMPIDWQFEHF